MSASPQFREPTQRASAPELLCVNIGRGTDAPEGWYNIDNSPTIWITYLFKEFTKDDGGLKRVTRGFILACCLLSAMAAVGESVEVRQIKPQQSSRHVRIAVALKGHAVKGAKVNFCRFVKQEQLCFSVITGEDGIAATPKLADGDYTVGASVDDDKYDQLYGGELYLHVSGHSGQKSFTVDLTESFRAAEAANAAADALPVKERLQEFQGSLRDPSGAAIAGVNIRILRKGSTDHAIVQKLKSDNAGQFSAHLDDGLYVAFFTFPGFRTQTVPFEVTRQGATELRITLQIGMVT